MVKFIKLGRFAIAYDDKKRDAPTTDSYPPPPPPPSPPPPPRAKQTDSAPPASGLGPLGKLVVILFGVSALVAVLGFLKSEPGAPGTSTASSPVADTGAPTPIDACGREDVQELVGKEARGIIFASARGQTVMLALFGLIDPREYRQQFEDANVTFSNIYGERDQDGSIACMAAMRIDASNGAAGQDILQSPKLFWHIDFPDGDNNLMSGNFTVEVDRASIADGMLINGKPPTGADGEQPSEPDESKEAQPVTQDRTSAASESVAAPSSTDPPQQASGEGGVGGGKEQP